MKVLFAGKNPFAGTRVIVMLCILQLSLFAAPACAQEQGRNSADKHRLTYGIHFGLTENKVDLFYHQSGMPYALEEGNHSFYTPGYRIAVTWGFEMGRCFSLRLMPGTSFFSCRWEPGNITVPTALAAYYKLESVNLELPVDVKFHPFRTGKVQPYLTSGLRYSYDFATISDRESIHRANANSLSYTCGLGVDCPTPYLKVGVELKASFELYSPSADATSHPTPFHFQGGPSFSIGLNIEA